MARGTIRAFRRTGYRASFRRQDIWFNEDSLVRRWAVPGTGLPYVSPITSAPVTTTVEADSPISLSQVKRKAIGPAIESPSAAPLAWTKWKFVGTVTESYAALAILRSKMRTAVVISESDVALQSGRIKRSSALALIESDESPSLGRYKAKPLLPPSEVDAALQVASAASTPSLVLVSRSLVIQTQVADAAIGEVTIRTTTFTL